jgi:hypothetical protein
MPRGSDDMVFQEKVGSEGHKNTQGITSVIAKKTRYEQNITKSVLAGIQGGCR